MRILLLSPPLRRTENAAELQKMGRDDEDCFRVPIGLFSLAAQLIEMGQEVKLCNHALTPWTASIEEEAAMRPALAGITCVSRQRMTVAPWARALKERCPDCRIIVGGVHATFLYQEILQRWPEIAHVAVGEADLSLPELARRMDAGEDLTGIPGIASRAEDGTLDWVGPAAPVTDLGALPIAARYFPSDIIATARGCPFNCTFCCSPGLWGSRVRERPVGHVIEELEILRRRHGITQVHIKDETFTARKSRVIEICQAMLDARLNLWWTCDTRVDCMDEERLYWMRKAGCFYVSFGIESGSPRILDRIQKRVSLDKAREATDLARRFGMLVRYYLIAGLPSETAGDMQATLNLARAGRPHFVCTGPLILSPGTKLFEEYCQIHHTDNSLWFDERQPAVIPFDQKQHWMSFPAARPLLALNNIGEGHDKTPHNPFTEEELRAAQARLEDCFAPNYDLALFLKDKGRPVEAEPFYRRALELRPEFGKGWLDLGLCLDAQKRLDEAVACWEKLETLESEADNNRLLALLYRGLAEAARGRLDEAVAFWKQVHARQPEAVDALRLIAERCAQAGRWSEVAWASERWLKLDSRNGQANYLLALAYVSEGANEDALSLFEYALQLNAKDPNVFFHTGLLLARMGRHADAMNRLQACLNLAPGHVEAKQLLGQIKAAHGGR